MDYKKLWLDLVEFFEGTKQSGWGKIQILTLMKERELEESRKND